MSGAEAFLAGSRDDGDAEVGLVVEPVEHLTHLEVSFEGDAVHLFLAVDGD